MCPTFRDELANVCVELSRPKDKMNTFNSALELGWSEIENNMRREMIGKEQGYDSRGFDLIFADEVAQTHSTLPDMDECVRR